MNNLDDAPLMLLVRRLEGESIDAVFAQMQKHYDARLDDSDWGPKYRIGSTFLCRGQKFSAIQTFAGSLIMQVVLDKRKGKFERPVIFRFNPDDRLVLLDVDGRQSEIDDGEFVQSKE